MKNDRLHISNLSGSIDVRKKHALIKIEWKAGTDSVVVEHEKGQKTTFLLPLTIEVQSK